MEYKQTIQEYEREWRREILNHKTEYPSLYADEVKKNNYKLFGNVYGDKFIGYRR